ncbi:hypothetical protein Tco_0247625 [Tanacetum coccineum]
MDASKRGSLPMQPNVHLSKTQGPSTPTEVKRMKGVPYASVVDMFLVYGGDSTTELSVTSYTDAGWETDRDGLQSQTGSRLVRGLRVDKTSIYGYEEYLHNVELATGHAFSLSDEEIALNEAASKTRSSEAE